MNLPNAFTLGEHNRTLMFYVRCPSFWFYHAKTMSSLAACFSQQSHPFTSVWLSDDRIQLDRHSSLSVPFCNANPIDPFNGMKRTDYGD